MTGGHKWGAVRTAALQKEEEEQLHLGCGWKGGCSMLTVMLGGDLVVALGSVSAKMDGNLLFCTVPVRP